jgi:hypothetical protein
MNLYSVCFIITTNFLLISLTENIPISCNQ